LPPCESRNPKQKARKNEATICGQCKQNITMDSFKLYPRRNSEVPDIRIPEGNWKRGWKPSIQRIAQALRQGLEQEIQ